MKIELFRLYTNGKTVVETVATWPDGKIITYNFIGSAREAATCTHEEFRKRYPYRVTRTVVEVVK